MDIQFITLDKVNIPEMGFNEYDAGIAWVNYGSDNTFPQKLIEYTSYSDVHNSILNFKTEITAGDGLNQEVPTIIQSDFLYRTSKDSHTFGGRAYEVIATMDRKSIALINQIDFSTLRKEQPNKSGMVTHFLYHPTWQGNQREIEPKRIPAFKVLTDEEKRAGKTYAARSIYYSFEYTPGLQYYPVPSYKAGLSYVRTAYEIAKHQLNFTANNFTPSALIFMNGEPGEDEKKSMAKELKKNYQGSDSAGRVFFVYGDLTDKPEIVPFDASGNADLYESLDGQITQHIITSHRLTSPVLAGLSGGAGNLGSNGNEIATAHELFYNTTIVPEQNKIVGDVQYIMSANKAKLEDLTINNKDLLSPLYRIDPQTLESILTVNEIRELAGFDELSPEQEAEFEEEKQEVKASVIKNGEEILEKIYSSGTN